MPVIITRSSNNYGPRAYPEKVIALFITNLIDSLKVPVYGEGKQIRDWLYVKDNCRAIYHLIDHSVNGEVYNIAGNQECPNLELTYKLLNLMGLDESMITFVQDRPGHDFRYSLDASKIQKLGWHPEYDLDRGLKETVAWYKNNEAWWRPLKKKMDKRFIKGYWGKKT